LSLKSLGSFKTLPGVLEETMELTALLDCDRNPVKTSLSASWYMVTFFSFIRILYFLGSKTRTRNTKSLLFLHWSNRKNNVTRIRTDLFSSNVWVCGCEYIMKLSSVVYPDWRNQYGNQNRNVFRQFNGN
jgi:hypothetical protein